ncbi:MAG: hypothetical protein ACKO5K_04675 [Armatimonadota bacterium]
MNGPLPGGNRYLDRPIGRNRVDRDAAHLVIRAIDANALPVHGCLFVVFGMACILSLGLLAMVSERRYDDTTLGFFAPRRNHFGFLWLVSTGVMALFLPWWIRRWHGPASVVDFSRPERLVRRRGTVLAPFSRLECVALREIRDPDGALLVRVSLWHTDGMECDLAEEYDESTARELANEISGFVGIPVRWIESAGVG